MLSCPYRFKLLWSLLICFSFALQLHAQVPEKAGETGSAYSCGADVMLNSMRKNNAYRSFEAEMNLRIRQQGMKKTPKGPLAPVYTLPVVFHIILKDPTKYSDADVQSALQELNDIYGQTGAFIGSRTDTKIQFCLARTDPNGGSTTGILRSKSYLGEFDADMEGGDITNMGKWDGSRYINIWVVDDIKSEFMQQFECGTWRRLKMGGYASAGGDIVVAGLGVGVLAHEMGHYLSLIHTFAAMDCKNNDCTTDGDMVCDTPPDKSINGGFACSDPENSCDTDTLSGFTTDVPDLPDNIMDYGGGTGCISSFTEGQAERMRNFIASSLPGMIGSTVCNDPCPAGTVTAAFTRSIDYPVTGNTILFTNTTTGATNYEWWVNGTLEATTTDFSYTVTEKKNYYVELRAFTATPGCFASFHNTVQVSCGVVARFYPDKRKIASKEDVEMDSILFTNQSENATAYRWLLSNNKGMAEHSAATSKDLKYLFKEPGVYTIRLEATNGTCTDTTNSFTFTVDDPTADGTIYVRSVDCYKDDQVRITLYFHNSGYQAFPINTPVAFYDKDPRLPGAKLLGTYKIPYVLKGKCTSYLETTIINPGRHDFDTVVAVMNDKGSPLPLVLPNTGFEEKAYGNNFRMVKQFRFKTKLTPDVYTLLPGEKVTLAPEKDRGGDIKKVTWSNGDYLNCTDCLSTEFTAPYRKGTVTTKQMMAESNYGCHDSATVTINLPPVDDYSLAVKAAECAAGDSVELRYTICNAYAPGNIPTGLDVAFYDGSLTAKPLANTYITTTNSAGACNEYRIRLARPLTGRFFGIVNSISPQPEAYTGNNALDTLYHPSTMFISPADTTVMRKRTYPLTFTTAQFTPASWKWSVPQGQSVLSCTACPAPSLKVMDTSQVKLVLTNPYGCALTSTAWSKPMPPDFIVRLSKVQCYDNTRNLLTFEVNMQNGYDSVWGGVPVSFYDADPATAGANLLTTVRTSPTKAGEWVKYTTLVTTPATTRIFVRVNDEGPGAPVTPAFLDTDNTNNTADAERLPFTVTLAPPVSSTVRPATSIKLQPLVTGGVVKQWEWSPGYGLSCTNCEQPVLNRSGSSMQYLLKVTNEFYCTDTAAFDSRTFINKRVEMPTAFSPNGDGVNDVFYVIGSPDIALVKDFIIYDRWGTQLFEVHDVPANDRRYGWDGMVNGNPSSGGQTYVYFINLKMKDDTVEMYKNTVVIVR